MSFPLLRAFNVLVPDISTDCQTCLLLDLFNETASQLIETPLTTAETSQIRLGTIW